MDEAPYGVDAALEALRWNWGEAYEIGFDTAWWFTRRDTTGGRQTAGSADALRRAIIDDYTARPVERVQVPSELAARRAAYEAKGVRIWHDPGGWHARWPVNGTHTGISHTSELSGLLNRLDALQEPK